MQKSLSEFIILDTETTGLRFQNQNAQLNDSMWQLSLSKILFNPQTNEFVKDENGNIKKEEKLFYFNDPNTLKKLSEMDPNLMKQLNLTPAVFQTIKTKGKLLKDCIPEIKSFIGNSPIVAYNGLSFDKKVLEFSNIILKDNFWFDPMIVAHVILPHANPSAENPNPGFKLENIKLMSVFSELTNTSNIEIASKAHDAAYDVYMLASVFENLIQLLAINNNNINDFIFTPEDLDRIYLSPNVELYKNKKNPNYYNVDNSVNSEFSRVISGKDIAALNTWNSQSWFTTEGVKIPKDSLYFLGKDGSEKERGLPTYWINNKTGELKPGNYLYATPLSVINSHQKKAEGTKKEKVIIATKQKDKLK